MASWSAGAADRSWLPEVVIDKYTGTDFAWAWNAPLLQIGGKAGVLVTSGRAFFTSGLGLLLSYLLRSRPLLLAVLGYIGTMYTVLTAITWPQRAVPLPPAPPPAPPPRVQAALEAIPSASAEAPVLAEAANSA